MFEYEQGQWQRSLINTVYKSVSDNWGDFTKLSQLKQLVDKAGVEGTDEGFLLEPSQYKDLTDTINGAIEGRGMPKLMDPSAYFKAMSAARRGASFNTIIANYGYGLPLAQRREVLYACASGDAAGGPAKAAFNGMRNELESLMKAMYLNQNAAKGTMYFFDGFERASDAITRFNMKIEAAIADNKESSRHTLTCSGCSRSPSRRRTRRSARHPPTRRAPQGGAIRRRAGACRAAQPLTRSSWTR
jgi:hypothetical protein